MTHLVEQEGSPMLAIIVVATDNGAVFLYLGVLFHPTAESHLGKLLNMQIFRLHLSLTKSKFLVGIPQSSEL